MRVVVTDSDGKGVFDTDLARGEKATAKSVRVWWHGSPTDREYDFRDVAVWWDVVDPDGVLDGLDDDAVAVMAPRLGLGVVCIQWTDDTDTNPRKSDPAGVQHTLEWPLPGGGMGPFIVQAG